MFKVGDKIRLRKEYHLYYWYSEEVFIIDEVDLKHGIVVLNKKLPHISEYSIGVKYIIDARIYEREEKILKIKERMFCNSNNL